MITEMKKRKYTPRRRAERQDQTRERIVRATMELHGERGFRATTVSAIAERAGVQRLTVYRHFPDDAELFSACSSLWLEHHPPPDPASWCTLREPRERLRVGLEALYRYYRGTRRMWILSYREQDEVPALKAAMAAFETYLGHVAGELAAPWHEAGYAAPELNLTVDLCVRFQTWERLADGGLDDRAMAELAACWVAGVARSPAPARDPPMAEGRTTKTEA